MDAPIREFFERIAGLEDPGEIAKMLAGLASEREYFDPLIEPIDPDQMGGVPLHVPETGPRLFLMHRPRGVMSYVHSHGTWAAVAPVRGVETHRLFEVVEEQPPDRAVLAVADERLLEPGDVAVAIPPADIHSHGHVGGPGETPYTLILTGADQLTFTRREYDLASGTYRTLAPGDFGTLNLPPAP